MQKRILRNLFASVRSRQSPVSVGDRVEVHGHGRPQRGVIVSSGDAGHTVKYDSWSESFNEIVPSTSIKSASINSFIDGNSWIDVSSSLKCNRTSYMVLWNRAGSINNHFNHLLNSKPKSSMSSARTLSISAGENLFYAMNGAIYHHDPVTKISTWVR